MGMITKESNGKKLSLNDRLSMAVDAGMDGVDFDEAGNFTPEQVRTFNDLRSGPLGNPAADSKSTEENKN